MKENACVWSAPGKVLLAGGYLVLDAKYNGLVYGLNARIYTKAQKLDVGQDECRVEVCSPQFHNAKWTYSVQVVGRQQDDIEVKSIRE